MKPFLQLVANDLRTRTGGDFSKTLVVFPGKRAGLFLDEYLAVGDAPLWTPRYTTITELFRLFCPLAPADPIETACRIYRLYAANASKTGGKPDTLDRFYGWAERLLGDFDDIDKALVDAHALFVNLGDLREIEAKEFLTQQQKDVLRQFFKDFDPDHNSYVRDRFLRLWRGMSQIYLSLQAELEAEGLAYEGMLQRRAVERLETGKASLPTEVERVAVVGFNVLSGVERKLFKLLQKETEMLFYWDYDTFHLRKDTEDGHFMRQNLYDFPNALPEEAFNNLLQPKDIRFVSATSDSAQARFIAPWLRENLTSDARKTAVVLCDENLLQPVLHALPEEVRSINITKGYPLAATETYATVMHLAEELEKRGTSPITFVEKLQESVQKDSTPTPPSTPNSPADILEQEARFSVYTVLTRFDHLVRSGRLAVTTATLRKLVKQVMRRQSIPFHGEPVEGLQIMGVLETRCLDFESIIILSADDNHLPRTEADNSFIPYFLREAYGLPTRRENAAVYAYYFHRLLARTHRAAIVWSTAGDSTSCGEMSRFMTQILVEAPQLRIRHIAIQAQSCPTGHAPLVIDKPADIAERLNSLSPSALNEYLHCPAKFYFRRVSRLKAYQEPTEGIAQNVFGTIFHDAAQQLYTDLSRNLTQPITSAIISHLLDNTPEPKLLKYIHQAFENAKAEEESLTGTLEDYPVEREVLLRMLKDLLRTERSLGNIHLIALEQRYYTNVEIPTKDGRRKVNIGGIIDRLDRVNGDDETEVMRVLDYKTGTPKQEEKFVSVDGLFKRGAKRPKYIFQTFLYALAVEGENKLPIRPALHYTSEAHKSDYNAFVDLHNDAVNDVRPLLPDFRAMLTDLVTEIHDPSQPFKANPEDSLCQYCDFRHICLH